MDDDNQQAPETVDEGGIPHIERSNRTAPFEQSSRLVHKKEFCERLGCSDTTLWRLIKKGVVPKPMKVTGRLVAWHELDVREHIDQYRRKPVIKAD